MDCSCCGKQPANIAYNGKCEDCYVDGCFPGTDRKRAYWDAMREIRSQGNVSRHDDRHRRNLKAKEMAFDSLE